MCGYEFLDHTSDVGVVARGDDIEDTLRFLCLGAFSMAYDMAGVEIKKEWVVEAAGQDLEEATIRMLNEALFLHETERALFSCFAVQARVGDGVSLEVRCAGEDFDPTRHRPLRQIKAATYHLVSVKPHEARVIFDV